MIWNEAKNSRRSVRERKISGEWWVNWFRIERKIMLEREINGKWSRNEKKIVECWRIGNKIVEEIRDGENGREDYRRRR